MTEYQRAARMPALQPWESSLNVPPCMKHFHICWKGENVLDELTWWRDCNTWCSVGYKSLTVRGQLYDVIRLIKVLIQALRPHSFIMTIWTLFSGRLWRRRLVKRRRGQPTGVAHRWRLQRRDRSRQRAGRISVKFWLRKGSEGLYSHSRMGPVSLTVTLH
jgi:hypothetical protein